MTVAPVAEVEDADRIREGLITPPLSLAINRESATNQEVGDVANNLTPAERAAILDAQAMELRGIAFASRASWRRPKHGWSRLAARSSRCAKAESIRPAG